MTREFSRATVICSYLSGAFEEADKSPEEHFSPLRVVVAREELEGSVVLAEDVVEEACSGGEEEAKPVHVVMSPQFPLRGVKEAMTRWRYGRQPARKAAARRRKRVKESSRDRRSVRKIARMMGIR
jgi:hypothetical protein